MDTWYFVVGFVLSLPMFYYSERWIRKGLLFEDGPPSACSCVLALFVSILTFFFWPILAGLAACAMVTIGLGITLKYGYTALLNAFEPRKKKKKKSLDTFD